MSADFFAEVTGSGKIFELGVGDGPSAFDARLRLAYSEEFSGRGECRMLRRDYGLFDATFVYSSSWRCSNLIVEVHRLAADAVADDVRRLEGVSLPQYVPWAEVEYAIHEAGKGPSLRTLQGVGVGARYGVVETGVVADVLDDGEGHPGAGDLWSISLTGEPKSVK